MSGSGERLELTISRSFDAPRALVFEQWLSAEAIGEWFPPADWEAVSAEMDARPGGKWRAEYRSGRGQSFVEFGVLREIVPYQRIVMSLTQFDGGTEGPETLIVVTFEDEPGGRTLMRFRQTGFDTPERRDGVQAGWGTCLDKLAARLVKLQ